MRDTIYRADAIEAIQNAYCKPCKERGDDYNEVRCRACEYDNAIIQIDALPSADTPTKSTNTPTDLISRRDAIDALAKFVPYAICDESTESYTNGLKDSYNLICQLPSAEPKTGEWVWSDEDASWTCGCCDCVFEEIDWKPDYNYCPNCGARMKGGAE